MSSQNLTNLQEDLKEVWEPTIREFLNNSDRTRAQFDQTSKGVTQGKYIKLASHIGRNSGFGFLGESEQTPTPGHQKLMNEFVKAKKAIGRIHLSSEVVEDSATNDAAIADAMSLEKDGLGRDARREINYLLHHDGNGVIATCGTTVSSTTVVLAAGTTYATMRYLFDVVAAGGSDTGLVVDIGILATPHSVSQANPVVSVDVAGKTITVTNAVSTSGSDFIFRAGQGGTGASQRVITSLPQIIDDTAEVYGADPASFPLWASTVIDAGNSAVTEDVFEEAFDLLDLATGDVYGNGASLIVTTHAIRKQLAASFQGRARYQPVELKGGFNSSMTIQAAGGPVGLLVDRDCRDYTAYLVTPDSFKRVVAQDWTFVEQAGSPIFFDKDDDSWHMLLRSRFEYICNSRRANARIDALGTSGSAF